MNLKYCIKRKHGLLCDMEKVIVFFLPNRICRVAESCLFLLNRDLFITEIYKEGGEIVYFFLTYRIKLIVRKLTICRN